MSALTDWLLACIAEDEAASRAVMSEQCSETGNQAICTGDDPWPSERVFAERLTPARVLADCEAKRAIVECHSGWHVCPNLSDEGYTDYCPGDDHDDGLPVCPTLRILAAVYADRPGWQEAWRL